MSTHRDTDERRDKARRLIAEGRTRREVADVLGVHVATVDRYRRDLGIPRAAPDAFRWNQHHEWTARLLIADGCPVKEIARTLGTEYRVIWRRFPDTRPSVTGVDMLRSHRHLMQQLGLVLSG